MAFLLVLHGRLAGALFLVGLAGAGWGAWAAWHRQMLSADYRGMLIAGQLLLIVQGGVGAALLATGRQPGQVVHCVYGLLAILIWPTAWVYARKRAGRHPALIYGFASFVIASLAARVAVTL